MLKYAGDPNANPSASAASFALTSSTFFISTVTPLTLFAPSDMASAICLVFPVLE